MPENLSWKYSTRNYRKIEDAKDLRNKNENEEY